MFWLCRTFKTSRTCNHRYLTSFGDSSLERAVIHWHRRHHSLQDSIPAEIPWWSLDRRTHTQNHFQGHWSQSPWWFLRSHFIRPVFKQRLHLQGHRLRRQFWRQTKESERTDERNSISVICGGRCHVSTPLYRFSESSKLIQIAIVAPFQAPLKVISFGTMLAFHKVRFHKAVQIRLHGSIISAEFSDQCILRLGPCALHHCNRTSMEAS